MRTSDLVCHDGNNTLSLKVWQAAELIRELESVCRTDVDDGSNPFWAGVINAFKFCVIESSMVDLESRRKSEQKEELSI